MSGSNMSSEHDEILGAWALDALDADERALIDAQVDGDAANRRTPDRLRVVVAALAQGDAVAPPSGLRDELLTAARAVPQQRDLASSPVQAYRHQLAVFSEVVDRIAGHQWHLQTHPYSWSLHGLVAHLLQIEQYMERSLGLTDGPADEFETDHLQFGHRQIQDELTRSPGATVATWREVVARIDPHLDALDLEHGLVFHQWPFAVRSLLIARSFELWTHADDVRRAIGEPVAGPAGADVRAMSDTSLRSLPLSIHVVADQVPNGRARIVLTGSGGGVWDLQLGAGGDELVTVVADAIDYCRVAARRLTIDELDAVIEGDAELAGRLLTAAAIVAV